MLKAEVSKYGPPRTDVDAAEGHWGGRSRNYTCHICHTKIEKDQAIYVINWSIGMREAIQIPPSSYACSEECVNIGILQNT